MKFIIALFTNPGIMIPLAAWFVAQLFKLFTNYFVNREFKLERLFGDGGMPSGHSATVMSLASLCAWCYGFGSMYFALAGVLAIIVMHDAVGVRREAGKHATEIKRIIELMNGMFKGETEQIRTQKLKELIGHTPLQVTLGAILGACVAAIYMIIAKIPYMGLI